MYPARGSEWKSVGRSPVRLGRTGYAVRAAIAARVAWPSPRRGLDVRRFRRPEYRTPDQRCAFDEGHTPSNITKPSTTKTRESQERKLSLNSSRDRRGPQFPEKSGAHSRTHAATMLDFPVPTGSTATRLETPHTAVFVRAHLFGCQCAPETSTGRDSAKNDAQIASRPDM